MTNLETLYAAERRLESELETVREQIREAVNYLGLNKIIRPEDFQITADVPGSGFIHKVAPGITVRHVPTGLAYHASAERSQHLNRAIALDAVKHELLSIGWREE